MHRECRQERDDNGGPDCDLNTKSITATASHDLMLNAANARAHKGPEVYA